MQNRSNHKFITYIVRDIYCEYSFSAEYFPEYFSEIVEEYCPDADLFINIGSDQLELNVCIDMFGLHEDLLELAEKLFITHPESDQILSDLSKQNINSTAYAIVLTDYYVPPIFIVEIISKTTLVLYKRILKDGSIVKEDDASESQIIIVQEFVRSIYEFLSAYVEDISKVYSEVNVVKDFKLYSKRLSRIRDYLD